MRLQIKSQKRNLNCMMASYRMFENEKANKSVHNNQSIKYKLQIANWYVSRIGCIHFEKTILPHSRKKVSR